MASNDSDDIETDEAKPPNPYWFRLREILKQTNGLQNLREACLPNGPRSGSQYPNESSHSGTAKNTRDQNVSKCKENKNRCIAQCLSYINQTATVVIPEADAKKPETVFSAFASMGIHLMTPCLPNKSCYPTYDDVMHVIERNILDTLKTSFPRLDSWVVRDKMLPSIRQNLENFISQHQGQLKPEDTAGVEVKPLEKGKKHGGKTELKVIVCFHVENCHQVNIENAFAIAVNGSVSIMS